MDTGSKHRYQHADKYMKKIVSDDKGRNKVLQSKIGDREMAERGT